MRILIACTSCAGWTQSTAGPLNSYCARGGELRSLPVLSVKLLIASLFKVVRPGAPSSVLAPSHDARSP